MCAGTPVHHEQTVRKADAASVCGYTGTLRANSQEWHKLRCRPAGAAARAAASDPAAAAAAARAAHYARAKRIILATG